MSWESDRNYVLGAVNFSIARAEIGRFVFTILSIFADPFEINPKAGAEMKHLPNILSEMSVPALFRFMEHLLTSNYSSMDGLREDVFAAIVQKGWRKKMLQNGKRSLVGSHFCRTY